MKTIFYFILQIFILLFTQTLSFVRVQSLAHYDGSSTNISIYHVKITNSGQIAYISLYDVDGIPKIKCYNISTGSFVLLKTYIQSTKTIIPSQIMIYSGGYLVGITPVNINFTAFLTNGTYLNRYTVNETVYNFIQSPSQNLVLYVATSGQIYWVLVSDFPTGNYKTLILSGILGVSKAVISPNTNYLAVGGSTDNRVYLIQLVGKTVLYTFTLNTTDTRFIAWSSDNTKIYVAIGSSGKLYQLLISSPYTISTYTYENSNIATVYGIQYYSSTNEVGIFTYKSSTNIICIYSYYLSNSSVYHKQNYNYSSTIGGNNWDASSNIVYVDWSSNQIWVKKIMMNCLSGYYYDDCLGMCNFCNANCTNCTAAGCGTCPVNTTNTTVTNTSTTNTTVTNTSTTNITTTNTSTTNVTTNTSSSNITTTNTTTNISSPSNTTTNTTQPSNTTNTTSSSNITSDDTNNTTNTNHTSNVINSTNNIIDSPDQRQMGSLYKNFQALLNSTLKSSTLQALNKVPACRKILKPIFTFFGNLDDFWFYIYHQRNYQLVMTSTFQSIQKLQQQKWQLIPYQTLWQYVGVDTSKLKQFFSYKLPYSSFKFIQVQSNPNGFFINTANFFLSNMLITILMFLICRFLFFLLFRYKISILFRGYSFWPYLMIIFLQGNLQFASYLFAFQLKWFFSINLVSKVLTVWLIVTFYFIFAFSVSCYFLFRYMYGQLAKYFFDNSKNSNISALYLMSQIGIKNILLGFTHLIDFESYTTKLLIIFTTQLLFFSMGIMTVGTKNIFQQKINAWINLAAALLRLIVIGTFYFQQNTIQNNITYTSPIYIYLISLYIYIGVLSMIIQSIKAILQILGYCRNRQLQTLIEKQKEVTIHKITLKNKKTLKIVLIDGDYSRNIKGFRVQKVNNQQTIHQNPFDFQNIDFDKKPKLKKFRKNIREKKRQINNRTSKSSQNYHYQQANIEDIKLNVSSEQLQPKPKQKPKFINMRSLIVNKLLNKKEI